MITRLKIICRHATSPPLAAESSAACASCVMPLQTNPITQTSYIATDAAY